jgi:hypothetical protein
MKRLLWLMCFCCLCPIAAIGCGDDSGDGNDSSDGGATIDEVSESVDNVKGQVDELNDNVMGLDKGLEGLGDDVDALTDQSKNLDERLGDLESGKGPNCSESDSCVPDGIDAVKKSVQALIERMCAAELDCCTEDERNYKFGPAIKTVDDCVETFNDVLENGISPEFVNLNGFLSASVIDIIAAINDDQVKIGLNDEGFKDCLEILDDTKCRTYEDATDHCEPTGEIDPYEAAPCSPAALLTSSQVEGGLCGGYYLSPLVPTCGEGLVCRQINVAHGICAPVAKVGDRCTLDLQCDKALFCNQSTGKCQEKGGVGDACAYVDPSFKSGLDLADNTASQSLECKLGLSCDPKSKKCVKGCSEGAICNRYEPSSCPEDYVCNVTENDMSTTGQGVCRKPLAKGKKCTPEAHECASDVCEIDGSGDYVCKDALKKAGAACSEARQADATCATGFCDSDKKCAKATCTGVLPVCPNDYYCETIEYVDEGVYPCEPLLENSETCNLSGDLQCESGHCDAVTTPATPVCANKFAEDSACTRSAQCPETQYCNGATTCTDLIAVDATCTGIPEECGNDADCIGSPTTTCQARAGAGDTCDSLAGPNCDLGLTCYVENGTQGSCYEPNKLGVGATCFDASQCASGWCNGDSKCAKPIAEGKSCDRDDGTKNVCAAGTYCKNPSDDSAGKCTKRGTAGQKCDPRFGSDDCLNTESGCQLRHDTFVCDTISVPEGELFCDGED